MMSFRSHSLIPKILKTSFIIVLILLLNFETFPKSSERMNRVRNIVNTLGTLDISDEQKELIRSGYLFMNINEAVSAASKEALEINKKAFVWAERVRLTSMLFFGSDIPLIDKLKDIQDDIKEMGSVISLGKIIGYSGKVVSIKKEMNSLYNNLHKFHNDKNLHLHTRNALALLWGTGRIINWLGGSVPIVGGVIKNYGSFLSNFSILIKKNYSFWSRKGAQGEIIGRDPNVKDYKGQPAETELYVATNRKVLIIKDLYKPGKGGSTAYFIKLSGKWLKMSVPQYDMATSIISDWISAFHEPEGGFWDWVARKSKDLRYYLKGRKIKARNTYPGTQIVADMITSPRKKIPGLDINRYELGSLAKQRLTDLADLRMMHHVLGGLKNFNQYTLEVFRKKRKWLSDNLPKLGIALSPEKEEAMLRTLFANTKKFERVIRAEAFKVHPGAEDFLRCSGKDPSTIHLVTLGNILKNYRSDLPIVKFVAIVKDKETKAPLGGVNISFRMTSPCSSINIKRKAVIKQTDNYGRAGFVIPYGCYILTSSYEGYYTLENDKPSCITEQGKSKTLNIEMTKIPPDEISRRRTKKVESPEYEQDEKVYEEKKPVKQNS